MASSGYRMSIAARHIDYQGNRTDLSRAKFYTTESSEEIQVAYKPSDVYCLDTTLIKKLFDSGKSFAVFVEGSKHPCRETLLNSAYHNARFFCSRPYMFPTIFVEYATEDYGYRLSPDKIEKCKKFANMFYGNKDYPVQIVQDFEGQTSVLMSVKWCSEDLYSLAKSLVELSLVLYIMRNNHIMDYIIKECDKLNRPQLMSKLAVKFLENDWGDDANPSLALSLYCYMNSKNAGGYFEFYMNGPARYAQYLHSTDDLYGYAKNIYIPTMGRRIEPTYKVTESLRKGMLMMLKLLKLEGENAG